MRADGSVHEQLQQVCAQHVPVVVVILLAVLAADYETADTAVSEECLVNSEVSEILLDRLAFVGSSGWPGSMASRAAEGSAGSPAKGSGGRPGGS